MKLVTDDTFSLVGYGLSRFPKESEIVSHDDFSIITNSATLRELSKFFLHCADTLENFGTSPPDGWHLHLRDSMNGWDEKMADIIVCSVNSTSNTTADEK